MKKWIISALVVIALLAGSMLAIKPQVVKAIPIQCGAPPSCWECYSGQGSATCYYYTQPKCYENWVTERAEDNALLSVNTSCIIMGGTPSGIIQFYGYEYVTNLTYQTVSVYAKRTCDLCAASSGCEEVDCGDYIIGGDPYAEPDPCCPSPIIIDVDGNGFQLSGVEHFVPFDLDGDGRLEGISWTAAESDDAFLALDRDDNNRIDDGKELFGNFTYQPNTDHKNGFLALAVFDENHDGVIDSSDPVFGKLKLWRDSNHDGISQRNELFPLSALGVQSINLDYKFSARRDSYGNTFRFRARVDKIGGRQPYAYDVFFVKQ